MVLELVEELGEPHECEVHQLGPRDVEHGADDGAGPRVEEGVVAELAGHEATFRSFGRGGCAAMWEKGEGRNMDLVAEGHEVNVDLVAEGHEEGGIWTLPGG